MMADRTYIVRFKQPEGGAQVFAASSAEIHGDHIVLLNSNGQLAALLLLEFVECWNEV
jgi:hypothetical protein